MQLRQIIRLRVVVANGRKFDKSTSLDWTGHHAGGLGSMADSRGGDCRRKGAVGPRCAWETGRCEVRQQRQQEPVVPVGEGDGVASRGGSQRVRGSRRDARRERSLEKTPGGLRRDDRRRETPIADESRDAAAEEGLHRPHPGG